MPRLRFTPIQWVTHAGAWAPLALLIYDNYAGRLSVNPIQDITFRTGKAALVLLILSLACTPLNSLFGWRAAIKLRRPLGVYAFLYVVLHFLTFVYLDYGLDLGLIYEAIFEKRFALVGFAAFLILLPLALTSTKGWQRRLGRAWKSLHKGVYVAVLLAVIHYVWAVKSDIREPLAYGAVALSLLMVRLPAVKRAFKAGGRVLARPPAPRRGPAVPVAAESDEAARVPPPPRPPRSAAFALERERQDA
jgi:sulfoxide reductase heme-binding subunit YedZ